MTSHNSKVFEMTYKRKSCIPMWCNDTISTTESWRRCEANQKNGVTKDLKRGGHGIHLEVLIRARKCLARTARSMAKIWKKCWVLLLKHPDMSYQSKALCLQKVKTTQNIEINTLIMRTTRQYSLQHKENATLTLTAIKYTNYKNLKVFRLT